MNGMAKMGRGGEEKKQDKGPFLVGGLPRTILPFPRTSGSRVLFVCLLARRFIFNIISVIWLVT